MFELSSYSRCSFAVIHCQDVVFACSASFIGSDLPVVSVIGLPYDGSLIVAVRSVESENWLLSVKRIVLFGHSKQRPCVLSKQDTRHIKLFWPLALWLQVQPYDTE